MLEKTIEDYICGNPESLFMERIIGRQIVLPHGILDILAISDFQVFVIELKAKKLQEGDIGQVLRYTYDVRRFLCGAGLYYYHQWIDASPQPSTLTNEAMQREWRLSIGYETPLPHEDPRLVPYLVGKSVDDKVLSAAEAAGVEVYTWTHWPEHDGYFSFSSHFFDEAKDYYYPPAPPFPRWADEALECLVGPCRRAANTKFSDFCYSLFGIRDRSPTGG